MYAGNLNLKNKELRYFKTIRLRFYAELNNFLPARLRQISFDYSFPGPLIVREVIESMKVPLSEVDLILVNSKAVDFNYPVNELDYVSVYPVFEQFDISGISQLRKTPLFISRFILDAHLGKLAKYLRMFGFDTLIENDYPDSKIREIASKYSRIILTLDKDLLTSRDVTHGYYVRSIHPKEQLTEIIDKFDLHSQVSPFTRCLICNTELTIAGREDISEEIDKDTLHTFNEFYKCSHCMKVYWKGSHYERMIQFIKGNLNA